eukprot:maker-scaffold1944_size24254-snap-gene-0.5 protein:Tk08984 transcript:maker-scaffold1944_size24254-snap-gene-0.5-mRNA-1 annotation:"hypothetical protein CAPTEDRAFT_115707"
MAPNAAGPAPKRLNRFTRFTKSLTLGRKMKRNREGKMVETLDGHGDGINCMALNVDESILITGSEDGTARIWMIGDEDEEEEMYEDRCLGVLEGHERYITCVSVLDHFVYTGSADGTIRKWDLISCECLFVYQGHNSKIHKLLVTQDLIFSTSHDRTARVWYNEVDEHPKACIRTFRGHGHAVYPLVYLPHMSETEEERDEDELIHPNDLLITGSADTSVKIWSLFSGECLKTLRNHTGSIIAMSTDLKGKILYTCGSDSFIKYWDIKTGKQIKSIDAHRSAIVCMHINHRLMYTGSQDGIGKCWVTEFGDNTVNYTGHSMSVTVMKFFKGLREYLHVLTLALLLITGCGDGVIRCYDAKSGHLLRTFSGHPGAVVALQPAGDKIYSATIDGTVRVFDIDWKFVKAYLAVLSGEIESVLGEEHDLFSDDEGEAGIPPVVAVPEDPVESDQDGPENEAVDEEQVEAGEPLEDLEGDNGALEDLEEDNALEPEPEEAKEDEKSEDQQLEEEMDELFN